MSNPRNISQDLRSAVIGVNHTKAMLFRDAKAALWIGGFFLRRDSEFVTASVLWTVSDDEIAKH